MTRRDLALAAVLVLVLVLAVVCSAGEVVDYQHMIR